MKPGDELGDYLLEALLGAGSMGRVFRAKHRSLRRTVAIKVLPPPIWNEAYERDSLLRFRREMKILAGLSHPQVVTLFAEGVHQGQPYMVMELMEGGSLQAWLTMHRAVPLATFSRWALQAFEGLAHLHEAQVLHRDLKPANLLLDGEKNIKLADFGLARNELNTLITGQDCLVGTPVYMAPEVLQGEAAGPASDVYSLGNILHEMLIGHPPFVHTDMRELSRKILAGERDPLHASMPLAPPPLERLVDGSLELDPAKRPSPREAIELLKEWGKQSHSSKRTPVRNTGSGRIVTDSGKTPRSGRPLVHAAIAAALVTCLGVGIGLGIGLSGTWRKPGPVESTSTPPASVPASVMPDENVVEVDALIARVREDFCGRFTKLLSTVELFTPKPAGSFPEKFFHSLLTAKDIEVAPGSSRAGLFLLPPQYQGQSIALRLRSDGVLPIGSIACWLEKVRLTQLPASDTSSMGWLIPTTWNKIGPSLVRIETPPGSPSRRVHLEVSFGEPGAPCDYDEGPAPPRSAEQTLRAEQIEKEFWTVGGPGGLQLSRDWYRDHPEDPIALEYLASAEMEHVYRKRLIAHLSDTVGIDVSILGSTLEPGESNAAGELPEALLASGIVRFQSLLDRFPRRSILWGEMGRSLYLASLRDASWGCMMVGALSRDTNPSIWSTFVHAYRLDFEKRLFDRQKHLDAHRTLLIAREFIPPGSTTREQWVRNGLEDLERLSTETK